jgi:2-polyprenyl-3-methyl-5-hydroxy-6-metoxy-1,4-benzoquinol methylase
MRLTPEASWQRYNPDYFWHEYLPSIGVVQRQFNLSDFDTRYAPMLHLLQHYRQSGKLLEVGCGAGFFLKAAERAGWDVTGVEVSQAAVDFARESLHLNVQSGTVETVPLPTNAFDVIALFDVIEHLFDAHSTLQKIHQLLRPSGVLVISTPNINALSRFILDSTWAVLSPFEHLYYFSEKTLKQTLRKAGFSHLHFERCFTGQGLYQTMNPHHNQAPIAPRSKIYIWFVKTHGARVFRQVQKLGLADTLYCVATKPSEK